MAIFGKKKRTEGLQAEEIQEQQLIDTISEQVSAQVMPQEIMGETTVVEEGMLPSEEYSKQRKVERSRSIPRIISLFLAEAVLLVAGFAGFSHFDLQNRAIREMGNRLTGEISLRTGTYTGETDFGWFDGTGEFAFKTGSLYTGLWEDNQIEGEGILKSPTEGEYDGEFKNGLKNGTGTFTWSDGSVYEGEWKNDQMSGQGVYKGAGKLVFDGTFKDNAFQTGHCTFENATGSYDVTYRDGKIQNAKIQFSDGATYDGTCGETALEGNGVFNFPDGDKYEGSFSDNKRNGSGTYTWTSGDEYVGEWASDNISGNGIYTFANGNKLEGTFKDNVLTDGTYTASNDFGTYTFKFSAGKATNATITLKDGTRYEGGMKDDKLTGTAQITYGNGDSYSGGVIDGQKSGSGVYTWKNGASYDGAWSGDTMDGRGTYTYPSGQAGFKLTGSFSKGVPNGKCTYYVSATESYETDWENGKCVKVSE